MNTALLNQNNYTDTSATTHGIITGNYLLTNAYIHCVLVSSPAAGACYCRLGFESTILGVFFAVWPGHTFTAAGADVQGIYYPIEFPGGLIIPRGDTLSIFSDSYNSMNGIIYQYALYGLSIP